MMGQEDEAVVINDNQVFYKKRAIRRDSKYSEKDKMTQKRSRNDKKINDAISRVNL